jgi:hypothetical protein
VKSPIPAVLTVSPTSLRCPFCKAAPGRDCLTTTRGFASVHIQRVKEAARISRDSKRRGEIPTKTRKR